MSLSPVLRKRFFDAYKSTLKSMNFTFQSDAVALSNSKQLLKISCVNPIEMKKSLFKDIPEDTEGQVKHLEEMSKILRTNVAQAVQKGKFKYELKMHEEIELGDNGTIKETTGTEFKGKKFKKCCD
ncbi:hypothetical protein QEN19_003668 [Hanseniaspora menglaensis]